MGAKPPYKPHKPQGRGRSPQARPAYKLIGNRRWGKVHVKTTFAGVGRGTS